MSSGLNSSVLGEAPMIEQVDSLERADQHKLGMFVFIASEAVFFAILILTYIYYRPAWTGRIELGATGWMSD